jgi:thioredoxin-dependent peroxiredoxin
MLSVGDEVPDLTAPLHDGSEFSTTRLRGTPYVIFFYPKDFTPTCTKEACTFRDRRADIAAAGADLYGVSLDGLSRHQAFADSLKLNFPLLADTGKRVAGAFGVLRLWGLLPFTKRVTFVVDREGIVRNLIVSETDVDKHVEEAIASLRSIR